MAVFSRADKRKQVMAVLDEVTASIDHLPRKTLIKILPVLDQAHRELERDIGHWLAREQGATVFTIQRYRNALANVRHAMARAKRHLAPTIEGALQEGAERAGALGTHNLLLEMEKFGQIFEGTIQPLALDQAAIIAEGDRLLWPRFATSAQRYAGLIGEAVVRELAVSQVRGETISEVASRLQRRLPAMFGEDRRSAQRLARTEVMNAYNVYHHEGILAYGEDDPEIVARWDGSYDWRRCPMCAELDGQVRDLRRGEKFSGGLTHPPAHPNCRCVVTPWREDWGDMARRKPPASAQSRTHAEAVQGS